MLIDSFFSDYIVYNSLFVIYMCNCSLYFFGLLVYELYMYFSFLMYFKFDRFVYLLKVLVKFVSWWMSRDYVFFSVVLIL